VEVNILIFSSSMRSTDVADIIIVIKAVDILWQKCSHGVDGVLSMIWVDVWHVVNSGKLSIDTRSLIENLEIFIDSNRTPVRNIDVSGGLGEEWQRIWVSEENLNLLKGDWGNVSVWTICVIILVSRCWLM
jgi:hypothetical protein